MQCHIKHACRFNKVELKAHQVPSLVLRHTTTVYTAYIIRCGARGIFTIFWAPHTAPYVVHTL